MWQAWQQRVNWAEPVVGMVSVEGMVSDAGPDTSMQHNGSSVSIGVPATTACS